MGMFTRIEDPETERVFQIKIGDDDLETFRVGDEIVWNPCSRIPDCGIDGVYGAWEDGDSPGYQEQNIGPDAWVVIVASKVASVILITRDEDGNVTPAYDQVKDSYTFTTPDPSLWSKEVREDSRKIEAEYQEECRLVQEKTKDLTPMGQSIALVMHFQRRRWALQRKVVNTLFGLPDSPGSLIDLIESPKPKESYDDDPSVAG